MKKIIWAARGKDTDRISDEDILYNSSHFEIWNASDCYNEDHTPKFNLDFLGKWRTTTEDEE